MLWAPYVSQADRKKNAEKHAKNLLKKGIKTEPVVVTGRKISNTFWGTAWCDALEGHSDFANRLPRGRTYARNGSVFDLKIDKGVVKGLVYGSQVYTSKIVINEMPKNEWNNIKATCGSEIFSVVELLQGKISKNVMSTVVCPKNGMFPKPKEMKFSCDCPDSASMCKHVAAVLYGVGNRLDSSPELLFKLRGVSHLELISNIQLGSPASKGTKKIATGNLSDVFGIDLDDAIPAPTKAKCVAKKPLVTKAKATVSKAKTNLKKPVSKPKVLAKSSVTPVKAKVTKPK